MTRLPDSRAWPASDQFGGGDCTQLAAKLFDDRQQMQSPPLEPHFGALGAVWAGEGSDKIQLRIRSSLGFVPLGPCNRLASLSPPPPPRLAWYSGPWVGLVCAGCCHLLSAPIAGGSESPIKGTHTALASRRRQHAAHFLIVSRSGDRRFRGFRSGRGEV